MLFSGDLQVDSPARTRLRDFYRLDESRVLDELLPLADIGSAARSRAWERARTLVVAIREAQVGKGGVVRDANVHERVCTKIEHWLTRI